MCDYCNIRYDGAFASNTSTTSAVDSGLAVRARTMARLATGLGGAANMLGRLADALDSSEATAKDYAEEVVVAHAERDSARRARDAAVALHKAAGAKLAAIRAEVQGWNHLGHPDDRMTAIEAILNTKEK